MAMEVDAVAVVGFDERNVAVVQARSNAFVQRSMGLRRPTSLPRVRRSLIYWFRNGLGRYEYLALLNAGESALAQAARERAFAWHAWRRFSSRIEREQKPVTTITMTAPIAGVIQSSVCVKDAVGRQGYRCAY
jgi:Cu(I)/Ag(I) efflux system membrane fusion protein